MPSSLAATGLPSWLKEGKMKGTEIFLNSHLENNIPKQFRMQMKICSCLPFVFGLRNYTERDARKILLLSAIMKLIVFEEVRERQFKHLSGVNPRASRRTNTRILL